MNVQDDLAALGRRAADGPPLFRPVPVHDADLVAAIHDSRIEIQFQPIYALSTGRIAGAEALARLPGHGGPMGLFERAEEAGLAERLSREAQKLALEAAGKWGQSLTALRVAINVLPADLRRANYADWLLAAIARAGLNASRVTVEVTEHEALTSDRCAIERLEQLRAAGITIALDDFGTGFANFLCLERLPLDLVKLDAGLIATVEHSGRGQMLVRRFIELARDLGLETVAEGVETATQLAFLTDCGCTYIQGFLRAPPMDQASLEGFLAAQA